MDPIEVINTSHPHWTSSRAKGWGCCLWYKRHHSLTSLPNLPTLFYRELDVPTIQTLPTLGRHGENKEMAVWFWNPSPALPPSMHTLTTPVYTGKAEKPGRQVLWEPERGIHVHVQPHAPCLVTLMPAEHRLTWACTCAVTLTVNTRVPVCPCVAPHASFHSHTHTCTHPPPG